MYKMKSRDLLRYEKTQNISCFSFMFVSAKITLTQNSTDLCCHTTTDIYRSNFIKLCFLKETELKESKISFFTRMKRDKQECQAKYTYMGYLRYLSWFYMHLKLSANIPEGCGPRSAVQRNNNPTPLLAVL